MRALFLGNSHVSAFKLAYDDMGLSRTFDASFFCARGADLHFTEVRGGNLAPIKTKPMSEDSYEYFMGLERYGRDNYLDHSAPLADVAAQFQFTGGQIEIDLSDFAAVFYVLGVSPYDLLQLGLDESDVSEDDLGERLDHVMGKSFLLRDQILEIRRCHPRCRHYLIGRPIPARHDRREQSFGIARVRKYRKMIAAMSPNFLFDQVFMPPEALLTDSMLSTRGEYCIDGRSEAETFQGVQPTGSDLTHMNRSYGAFLFRNFVIDVMENLDARRHPLRIWRKAFRHAMMRR